jgi:hypothetical protein
MCVRMSMHDRTTALCCLLWDGHMFFGSNDRVASFMMCDGSFKILFCRNSSSSTQIKTSHRWKRKRDRERTNRRHEIFSDTICTINTTAVWIASFHFNSIFILVSRNFTSLLFSHFHRMHSPYIFVMASKKFLQKRRIERACHMMMLHSTDTPRRTQSIYSSHERRIDSYWCSSIKSKEWMLLTGIR